ncbi:fumarylacetoacetate hydrolase family protein [Falsiroseomonas selenitidurans]|uniref:Fumarylacetoacetate hydrolase family protein n=1 Tax=Falsiroseomonas selenitidurans TaxID=2716335 RepID=A0ABX1E0X9_9PROT|nr:fumarylacetoacetate hydrolase family protein [Falsiroseomonas selenitidurans]NKC30761.1 fumarylacetoacetate hydrolase family protein [Falsiroseomonas selenitidurans]OYW22007.1 MAG: 5-carboxymethyl-2-hydroxymuconate isomerase [Burkholderiales bacterium 12-64-5]
MKLLSFRTPQGASHGVLRGETVTDLGRRTRYPTLRALLEAGEEGLAAARAETAADHTLPDLALLPPLPDAGKIIGIGLNYRSHVAEQAGREPPPFPRVFSRWNDSVVGHGEALLRPKASLQFDYEGELAIVIGRPGRHIAKADAYAHIAGYACFCDGSVRDWQQHTTTSGKNFFRSGACGPFFVTADEVGDPTTLTLRSRLNGEEVQHASTGDLIYDIPTLLHYVSTITPLAPGDIIASGTPEGVGSRRTPPRWLRAGDVFEVEITGLGTLRNHVIDEEG